MPILIKDPKGKPRLENYFALNVKDGSVLLLVPGGDFEMGDGQDKDCPKHVVELSEYWIGIYCVTNRQYAMFVAETGHRAPDNDLWKNRELLDHPVTNVSWVDCASYAEWSGLSLPSEAQWEKAARGPGGVTYPWGDEWDEGKCRNSNSKGSETTEEVWKYPEGESGYGTLQQSGNVWEWCADWFESDYYEKSPTKDPAGPQTGSGRVCRGGCWGIVHASDFRGAYRNGSGPANRAGGRGFRLVRNSP